MLKACVVRTVSSRKDISQKNISGPQNCLEAWERAVSRVQRQWRQPSLSRISQFHSAITTMATMGRSKLSLFSFYHLPLSSQSQPKLPLAGPGENSKLFSEAPYCFIFPPVRVLVFLRDHQHLLFIVYLFYYNRPGECEVVSRGFNGHFPND